MHLSTTTEDWRHGGFGLYLHWPFCQSKCPYCDFNSHVASAVDQNRWQAAYLSELERIGHETQGRVLQSVFFGGGTPSLMDPELVHSLLQKIRHIWPSANDLEITMEANPSSVEAGRFRAYRDAGVNRVSVGVQALNDADLKALGRLHSVTEAIAAVETAKATFDRVSFDLIYARQGQSLEDWKAELSDALALADGHLSLYQLTIEDGTAFGDRFKRGLLRGLPDEDLAAELYLATNAQAEAAGYAAYEVSNYAKNDQESRHNILYWNGGDYAGIGPGAHGRLTLNAGRISTEATASPMGWLSSVENGKTAEARAPISASEQGTEYLMMGLRRSVGIDIVRYERITGHPLPTAALDELLTLGMVSIDKQRLVVTQQGRLVLNAVIAALLD